MISILLVAWWLSAIRSSCSDQRCLLVLMHAVQQLCVCTHQPLALQYTVHCRDVNGAFFLGFLTDQQLNMRSAHIPCVHSYCQRGVLLQRSRPRPCRCQADNHSSFSDVSLSSRVSKGLVAGLTAFVNGVAGSQAESVESNLQEPAAATWSPEEVLEGVVSASTLLLIAPCDSSFNSAPKRLTGSDCCVSLLQVFAGTSPKTTIYGLAESVWTCMRRAAPSPIQPFRSQVLRHIKGTSRRSVGLSTGWFQSALQSCCRVSLTRIVAQS